MSDEHGGTADPRRRVLARIESEPIPYGTWSALFDTVAEAAALDMGVMLGGHVIDCADNGWEPAPGANPESWRSSPVESVRLRVSHSAIRAAINLLGPEPCTCPISEDCAHGCGGSRAEVAEALRVLREGLGETGG